MLARAVLTTAMLALIWKVCKLRTMFEGNTDYRNTSCMEDVFQSFCLRDRGRLGNEGQPISLKISTQSRYVNLCNMPKFQLARPFSSRVLDISPSGVPIG